MLKGKSQLVNKVVPWIITCLLALAACSPASTTSTSGVSSAQTSSTSSSQTVSTNASAATITEVLAGNSETHEGASDSVWDESKVVQIALNGNSITADDEGVRVDGSTVTITSPGTYSLSGTLADGQIQVNTVGNDVVRLILNGVEIRNSSSAAIYVMNAEKTVLILADNTTNVVSDAAQNAIEGTDLEDPNAAIYSMSDLSIYGSGTLTVNGNYKDGITSKDGLVIASASITVNAVDDGIQGKDYLVIESGNIIVNAQGDGLKSDNEEDAAKGYISVESGVIQITSGGDGMDAASDVLITGGDFTITSGGGSSQRTSETISTKSIKGTVQVIITQGSFNLDSADDAIHTNGSLRIDGGTFEISSGDDGMHADATLEINGGVIQIQKSYEGIESAVITINAGEIHVVASDDGLNVAGGNDSSGMNPGGGPGGKPDRNAGAGTDTFTYTGNYYLYIHGGYIVVDAAGDGLDINGAIEMTNGTLLVNGPTENMNAAVDYDATFVMTGGYLVAAGSSGMAQQPSASSSQNSLLINFTNRQPAGTIVHIQNSADEDVLTFVPVKEFQSITLSSTGLVTGEKYTVYLGGSSSGVVTGSLVQGGSYSGGTQYTSLKITEVATRIGSSGNRP
jgi:hypothetical protein